MIRAVLVASVLAGCSLSPDYTGTHYRCDQDNRCPGALQCIENLCQDSLVGGTDAAVSDGSVLDGGTSTTACGGGDAIFLEGFEEQAVDETIWSINEDDAAVMIAENRLVMEPQSEGASASITTIESFPLEGTRLTLEMLPVEDVTSSGASVALVDPSSTSEMATFFRDTFDLFLHTDNGEIAELAYSTVDHRFLRVEAEGDAIRFYASRDGDAWDLLATDPDATIPLEVELSIWVENYAGDIQPYRFDSIAWCTLD